MRETKIRHNRKCRSVREQLDDAAITKDIQMTFHEARQCLLAEMWGGGCW